MGRHDLAGFVSELDLMRQQIATSFRPPAPVWFFGQTAVRRLRAVREASSCPRCICGTPGIRDRMWARRMPGAPTCGWGSVGTLGYAGHAQGTSLVRIGWRSSSPQARAFRDDYDGSPGGTDAVIGHDRADTGCESDKSYGARQIIGRGDDTGSQSGTTAIRKGGCPCTATTATFRYFCHCGGRRGFLIAR